MTSYHGQTCKSCEYLTDCLQAGRVLHDEVDVRFCRYYRVNDDMKPLKPLYKRIRDDRKYYRVLVDSLDQDHYSRMVIFDCIKHYQPICASDIVRSTMLTYGQVVHQLRMLLKMKIIEVVP